MPHIRSLLAVRRLRAGAAILLSITLFGLVTVMPAKPVSGQSADSAVIIDVQGYNGTVTFHTTGHSLGNCNSVSNLSFTVNNGRTCSGLQMGTPDGMNLHLSSVPAGYQFDGFAKDGFSYVEGSASCSSASCYFNFSSGTFSLVARFSPVTTPTAPQLSVSNRTTNSIGLSWTAGTAPGGLNRYEVLQANQVIHSTAQRSFTQGGLSCGQNYTYNVRIVDNQGRAATSNTVTTSTFACPASSTGSGSSGSSARTVSASSSSGNQTAAVAGSATDESSQTATSSTSTNGDILGEADEDSGEAAAESTDDSDGLTNLEKIVLGVLTLAAMGGLARYFYLRQDDKDQY